MAESLLQGDTSLSDFLSDYKAKRTLAHMRRIKTDKMRELVLDVQRNPVSSIAAPVAQSRNPVSSHNAPPYPGSANPGIMPYPGAYPRPQPGATYAGNARQPYAYNWGPR